MPNIRNSDISLLTEFLSPSKFVKEVWFFRDPNKIWSRRYWHRIDGPAIVRNDGKSKYFLFGINIPEEEYNFLSANIDELEYDTDTDSIIWIDSKLELEHKLRFG